MFKRNAVTLALVLILGSVSAVAMAQTSPSLPGGGGSAKRIWIPTASRPGVTVTAQTQLPNRPAQSILAIIRAGAVSPWIALSRSRFHR